MIKLMITTYKYPIRNIIKIFRVSAGIRQKFIMQLNLFWEERWNIKKEYSNS